MFWLYVMVYTSGRLWIEMLRIDTAVHIYGVRINVWVASFVLLLGVAMFLGLGRRHRGQTDDLPARPLPPRAGVDDALAKVPAASARGQLAPTADTAAETRAPSGSDAKKP